MAPKHGVVPIATEAQGTAEAVHVIFETTQCSPVLFLSHCHSEELEGIVHVRKPGDLKAPPLEIIERVTLGKKMVRAHLNAA
jgi:hypothetical protein